MGMDAHIAFKCRRHKRMRCFHERQIPPPMGIHCNQLKALCVRLWSWRSLGASQLHATGPWPSVAPWRLGSEIVCCFGMRNCWLLNFQFVCTNDIHRFVFYWLHCFRENASTTTFSFVHTSTQKYSRSVFHLPMPSFADVIAPGAGPARCYYGVQPVISFRSTFILHLHQ